MAAFAELPPEVTPPTGISSSLMSKEDAYAAIDAIVDVMQDEEELTHKKRREHEAAVDQLVGHRELDAGLR